MTARPARILAAAAGLTAAAPAGLAAALINAAIVRKPVKDGGFAAVRVAGRLLLQQGFLNS